MSNKVKCRLPVVSIGNISVGGTGKTPLIITIADELLKIGLKPAIVGRGYGRESKGLELVSDGEKILGTLKDSGDEMLMIAKTLPVPVVVHESKSEAASQVENLVDADIILVDDGFQHRRLSRDLDIVIIDKKTIENPKLIPCGRLRESLKSLQRADIICIYDNKVKDILKDKYRLEDKLYLLLESSSIDPYLMNSKLKSDPDAFSKPFLAVSGIANPERFFRTLEDRDIYIKETMIFKDHHNYMEKDIDKLLSKCRESGIKNIAITEKDKIKIENFKLKFDEKNINCYVFPIRTTILEGKEKLIQMIRSIIKS